MMGQFRHKLFVIDKRDVKPRGFVLVAVVVVFAFAMTLFGLWAKAAVQRQRQSRSQQFRMQAERLAEAGLQRAAALRAVNQDYDGETWSIPAGRLHPTRSATVRIQVAPNKGAAALRVHATAEFPADALHRAKITRTIDIPAPNPGDES